MHLPARTLREKIADGRPVIGTFLVESASPGVVGVAANAGFDFLMIDGEHGNQNPREIELAIELSHRSGLCTIVRPPDGNRAVITRSLDAGAAGVIVPFCCTEEEVRQVVRATKYMPMGQRGTHLFRGHTQHRSVGDPAAFMAEANRDLLTLIQIELAAAVPLVEQFAAMEGVDGLYVGPGDLSVDFGIPGQWDAPVMLDAIRATAAACRRHGKIMGCHIGDIDKVEMLRQIGVQMFGYQCDVEIYSHAFRSVVARFAEAVR